MAKFKTLDDLDPRGKRVLVRVDFNVPVKDGRVSDVDRIERTAPTIDELASRGGRVVLISHLGRPKGKPQPEMSLEPVVEPLQGVLGRPVAFVPTCIGTEAERAVAGLDDGEVVLLENLRFHSGEEANDRGFAAQLAALGDLYVNDAFAAAHRAHASVEALARALPAAAGRLMQTELQSLAKVLETPERPVAALVGGAKVSTKLDLLGHLIEKTDMLIIGGGMANTFLASEDLEVGKSLCEHDLADTARSIIARARGAKCEIVLPSDVVIASRLAEGVEATAVSVDRVPADRMILDIGPATAEALVQRLASCKTLVWNGPLGCFEVPPFDAGTNRVAAAAADRSRAGHLVSVAGGGDTVAALRHAGALDGFTYVSTAGGAFLEWLEGKPLPGVAALEAALS